VPALIQSFDIPVHTTLLNVLLKANRYRARRLKLKDETAVSVCARSADITRAEVPRRVSLHITLGKRQRRPPDRDAWWKSLLDALVACGLLVDDSPRWCDTGTVTYDRASLPSMRVTLEDLPS
jgi:Holliday junction resolvase RusA-like endonuclease